MEEDDEIELLLKSNEALLMKAAQLHSDGGSEDIEDKQLSETSYNSSSQIDKKSVTKESYDDIIVNHQASVPIKDSCLENDCNDEVQDLIDDHILSYMTKRPSKHVLHLHSMSSDEENEMCEDDSDEGDEFINEIMDHSSEYKEKFVEHVKNITENKNKLIGKLISANRSVLERDNVLRSLELRIREKLDNIAESTEDLNDKILSLCEQNSNIGGPPQLTKGFYKKFGVPYFKDSSGFSHQPNMDHAIKNQTDQTGLILVKTPLFWTKSHQQKLLKAIKDTLTVEKTDKLINQINKIKSKLDTSPSDKNDKKLYKQLNQCQEELINIEKLSFKELISDENPDRNYDWMKYSLLCFDGEHDPDECKRFWEVYLKPTINKTGWTLLEDNRLSEIATKMQLQDWDSIAKELGTNRSAYQCFIHFQTRFELMCNNTKGKWTQEEDEKLLNIIRYSKIGSFIPWTKVSCHMGDRTHTQIYNRFKNCLDPKIIKGKFTRGEDLLIVAGVQAFNCNYNEIASVMKNRSVRQISERYERYLTPKTSRIGSWTLQEDDKLMKLVEKYGNNWSKISKEIKTRSRTQVRQRFAAIQRIMNKNPGLTINQFKRRNIHLVDKSLPCTDRRVKNIKKKVDKIEQSLNLSNIESNTFRIEKLQELRDNIVLQKYRTKAKIKKREPISRTKAMFLEYFKHNQIIPPKSTTVEIHNDSKACSNELHLLAKYFGHDLQIPDVNEIKTNPRLSFNLKKILIESISSKADPPEQSVNVSYSYTRRSNIDYIPPEKDTSIVMNEEWVDPQIDLKSLNFSEILKKTVFDYSSGMHKDIWVSKMKRTSEINLSSFTDEHEQHQFYNMPPNYLTSLALKSVMLSRVRLKQDKEDVKLVYCNNEPEILTAEMEVCVNKLLHQFQETLITLFTWPRTLSFNTNSSNPTTRPSNKTEETVTNKRTVLNKKKSDHQNIKRNKIMLEQRQNIKRQLISISKGVKCNRKIKIEHLINKELGNNNFPSNNSCLKTYKNKKFRSLHPGDDSSSLISKITKNHVECLNDKQALNEARYELEIPENPLEPNTSRRTYSREHSSRVHQKKS